MSEPHKAHQQTLISGVPEGLDARVIADLAAAARKGDEPGVVIHVARDDRRLEQLERGLQFFAPDIKVITFPAWDTVPYDRVGPEPEIVARRIAGLARLVAGALRKGDGFGEIFEGVARLAKTGDVVRLVRHGFSP